MCNSLTSAIRLFYIINLFSLSLQLDHQGRMPMFVLAPLLSFHLQTYQIITFIRISCLFLRSSVIRGRNPQTGYPPGIRRMDIRRISALWRKFFVTSWMQKRLKNSSSPTFLDSFSNFQQNSHYKMFLNKNH